MKLLLKLFSNSLKVKSLASIADLDTQKFEKETLGRAEDPEFELHVAARLLLSTLGKIQRLLVDYRGSTGEIKHLKVGIHAIESVGNKLDTVNLFERNVLRGIFAHWKQLLKREAEKWHDIENPYVAGLPLDASSRVFIGRGEVFDWIHKKLSGSDGKNVLVLHGGMRTGKTSILKQLAFGPLGHELRTRAQRPVFPVFVDLQKFADPGTWPLLFGLAEAIRDSLTNGPSSTQVPCPQPALDEFREVSYLAFDRFLDRVDEQVARKRNGLLAIMWDEFEKLDERVQSQKLDPEIFSYLRSKMQHQPSVTFILAGQHSLEDMTPRFRDIVFNVALHYQVGCLTQVEAKQLIREPVEASAVVVEDHIVERILNMTGGHPYFVQQLCQGCIDHLNHEKKGRTVTESHVQRSMESALPNNPTLESFWTNEKVTDADRAILRRLALQLTDDSSWIGGEQLIQGEESDQSTITESLEHLVSNGLLLAQSAGGPDTPLRYRFQINMFRSWVRENAK